jgi:hypothetical protein
MKKYQKLIGKCRSRDFNISITCKKTTGYSIEIYKGGNFFRYCFFHTQDHANPEKAINKALKFMKATKRNKNYKSLKYCEPKAFIYHPSLYNFDYN